MPYFLNTSSGFYCSLDAVNFVEMHCNQTSMFHVKLTYSYLKADDGTPLVDYIRERGIIPGIKVHYSHKIFFQKPSSWSSKIFFKIRLNFNDFCCRWTKGPSPCSAVRVRTQLRAWTIWTNAARSTR
jgi:hypothetical protein